MDWAKFNLNTECCPPQFATVNLVKSFKIVKDDKSVDADPKSGPDKKDKQNEILIPLPFFFGPCPKANL